MPADLVDLRAKVTPETAAALEAEHLATGADKSEIVREILHRWARGKVNECSVLLQCLAREGIEPPQHHVAGKRGA